MKDAQEDNIIKSLEDKTKLFSNGRSVKDYIGDTCRRKSSNPLSRKPTRSKKRNRHPTVEQIIASYKCLPYWQL